MVYKTDLLTGEKFIPARANQNFASAANRIKYYNQKANETRHKAAFVNKPLHANFLILNNIMGTLKEKVFHKQFLLGKGFSFGVNTHCEVLGSEKHFAIYHYIMIPLQGDQIKIIRK
jgi:hypothetical protein